MKVTYSHTGHFMSTPQYTIFRWHKDICPTPGTYRVVAVNHALARMQGAEWEDIHPTCVVDDFGTLVRVAA
jgi:hypothetical protein